MKNIFKFGVLSLSLLCLVACGGKNDDAKGLLVYQAKVGDKIYDEHKESRENGAKTVYRYSVLVMNESGTSKTLKKEDFTMKIGGETYPCLYFCQGWGSETLNGVKNSYITETSETVSLESNEKAFENFAPVFAIGSETYPCISYLGNLLTNLG